MPDRPNVLLIMSDEHRPDAMGCAGHPMVETPNLDRLAAEGARFDAAYCPSPLCAPSRASFVTGRYVHEIGNWDNASSYGGTPESWGHRFHDRGVPVTTVGKLDFRPDVVGGFEDQRLPKYRPSPDVNGLDRDPVFQRENARERITAAGPVDDPWYESEGGDADVAEATVEALEERAAEESDDPWVLWTNFLIPHFPLRVGREYYERYPEAEVDLPVDHPAADDHPILEELRYHFDGRDVDEETLRRTRAAYYGLCTALDDYVGRLLDALDDLGLAEETLVVYTSDHGEPLGDHECWWKCCMYESAAGVPMIARGPGVREGVTVDQPVSLLDLVPTMADAVGVDADPAWRGESLLPVLRGEDAEDDLRVAFSEYHAHGTSHGAFMVRQGRYKYVHYPENPPQLFDLEADPEEVENLADEPGYAAVRSRMDDLLRGIVDPEAADRRALESQRARRERPVEAWW